MRTRVRAIIIKNNAILLIKRTKPNSVYWVFPGGGVEDGEDNKGALVRECKEELGVDVNVLELMSENFFTQKDNEEYKEYFYNCLILGGKLGSGKGPEYEDDSNYEGGYKIEWIDMNKLKDYDIKPMEVRNKLIDVYSAK